MPEKCGIAGRYVRSSDSPVFRKIAVIFVLFIGFFYTMPQMKGAGTTLAYIFPGLPYWAGVVLVGAVITLNVSLGGMKGITLVQAFQYWAKMFAISVPVFVLMAVYGHYGTQLEVQGVPGIAPTSYSLERKALPEKAPKDATWLNPFGPLTTKPAKAAAAAMVADSGSSDPAAGLAAQKEWLKQHEPVLALIYTYSLIIALVCGTAGLPHILVRFYTNPDGVAAKRTTMWVMILIGIFYVFPPVFGVMGRNLLPELYAAAGAKGTDKIVLELPRLLNERYAPLGSILSGITCAGAFAAFMSTFSGLLVSMTGALAHDVYGRMLRPKATPEQRMRMFRWCSVLLGAGAIIGGMQVEPLQINFMVGQAFAIAAASYFPLLFMSTWWRSMTMKGAAAGMMAGGCLAVSAISLTSFSDLKWIDLSRFWTAHPLLRTLCEQPAIWTVPTAILTMIVVSKLTQKEVPMDIRMKMLVLHAPEKLGLKAEYIQEHVGH